MSRFALIRVGFLFLLLSFTVFVKAQKGAEAFNIDPTLYSYYQRCQEHILQPNVINMTDTLFQMAAEKGDKRMQAVAISTKLDYHYFQTANEDSIIYYTNEVKKFAKATKQPKYYYFAWANRLILFYLKTGKTNFALYEAQKMLKVAQDEDDKTGLSSCYNIMSQIYTVKRFYDMAFEWHLKQIELIEKYQLENYNISLVYTQIANYYIDKNLKDEALQALEKAKAKVNAPTQQILIKLEFANYYSKFGDFKAAEKILRECNATFDKDKRMESLKKRLYSTECTYYRESKQYQKALEAADKQEMEQRRLNESIQSSNYYRTIGEIYSEMGNPNQAVKYLQMYIKAEDSLKIANEQMASSEFATLLDVEKLNLEKKELMLQAQQKEIRNKTTLIISLIILLGVLFLFVFRESKLNRKLKISEGELKIRNEELIISREDVRKARDRAEANSRMKTTFIQSMSHEIRTPLNSIVGFSQVLNELYCKEFPESKEFVKIIENNSNDLLRLVTDVLALSELDQHDKLPTDIKTDINMVCQVAYETAKDIQQDGVEEGAEEGDVKVIFKPERKRLVILSNPERISQVLTNLARNAVKFTTHGSITIAYSVMEANKMIEISVTDTGIGIPKDKQYDVFERFYKINSFTQGTGLGLSICRSIAEKLGGNLHIDFSYTEGCRMVLTLPLVYPE
ncbi:HAMP domain-containing sensor histidine kinase [uncultured Bacteroides sp.]|uniref:tetratricopeptide repeat-containing sensor histidine kinase n=1 Tax=uncultured Bacteroides sp. TaxID=162156 RepID=UPI0025CE2D46|nr:HAMP domain-containing sensor histidine kinase [uncultured Bacteroides sp.]